MTLADNDFSKWIDDEEPGSFAHDLILGISKGWDIGEEQLARGTFIAYSEDDTPDEYLVMEWPDGLKAWVELHVTEDKYFIAFHKILREPSPFQ